MLLTILLRYKKSTGCPKERITSKNNNNKKRRDEFEEQGIKQTFYI